MFSVDRVRGELLAGHETEDLVRWVRDEVPDGFFLPVDTDAVVSTYTDIEFVVPDTQHRLHLDVHDAEPVGQAHRPKPRSVGRKHQPAHRFFRFALATV